MLNIKVIGDFTIPYGGPPGGHEGRVHAVSITADPESGQACKIGVQTGRVSPNPGATVLFTH